MLLILLNLSDLLGIGRVRRFLPTDAYWVWQNQIWDYFLDPAMHNGANPNRFFFTKSRTTIAVMQIKWTLNLELADMNMTQNTMIEKPGIPQSTNFIKEIIFKKQSISLIKRDDFVTDGEEGVHAFFPT